MESRHASGSPGRVPTPTWYHVVTILQFSLPFALEYHRSLPMILKHTVGSRGPNLNQYILDLLSMAKGGRVTR